MKLGSWGMLSPPRELLSVAGEVRPGGGGACRRGAVPAGPTHWRGSSRAIHQRESAVELNSVSERAVLPCSRVTAVLSGCD